MCGPAAGPSSPPCPGASQAGKSPQLECDGRILSQRFRDPSSGALPSGGQRVEVPQGVSMYGKNKNPKYMAGRQGAPGLTLSGLFQSLNNVQDPNKATQHVIKSIKATVRSNPKVPLSDLASIWHSFIKRKSQTKAAFFELCDARSILVSRGGIMQVFGGPKQFTNALKTHMADKVALAASSIVRREVAQWSRVINLSSDMLKKALLDDRVNTVFPTIERIRNMILNPRLRPSKASMAILLAAYQLQNLRDPTIIGKLKTMRSRAQVKDDRRNLKNPEGWDANVTLPSGERIHIVSTARAVPVPRPVASKRDDRVVGFRQKKAEEKWLAAVARRKEKETRVTESEAIPDTTVHFNPEADVEDFVGPRKGPVKDKPKPRIVPQDDFEPLGLDSSPEDAPPRPRGKPTRAEARAWRKHKERVAAGKSKRIVPSRREIEVSLNRGGVEENPGPGVLAACECLAVRVSFLVTCFFFSMMTTAALDGENMSWAFVVVLTIALYSVFPTRIGEPREAEQAKKRREWVLKVDGTQFLDFNRFAQHPKSMTIDVTREDRLMDVYWAGSVRTARNRTLSTMRMCHQALQADFDLSDPRHKVHYLNLDQMMVEAFSSVVNQEVLVDALTLKVCLEGDVEEFHEILGPTSRFAVRTLPRNWSLTLDAALLACPTMPSEQQLGSSHGSITETDDHPERAKKIRPLHQGLRGAVRQVLAAAERHEDEQSGNPRETRERSSHGEISEGDDMRARGRGGPQQPGRGRGGRGRAADAWRREDVQRMIGAAAAINAMAPPVAVALNAAHAAVGDPPPAVAGAAGVDVAAPAAPPALTPEQQVWAKIPENLRVPVGSTMRYSFPSEEDPTDILPWRDFPDAWDEWLNDRRDSVPDLPWADYVRECLGFRFGEPPVWAQRLWWVLLILCPFLYLFESFRGALDRDRSTYTDNQLRVLGAPQAEGQAEKRDGLRTRKLWLNRITIASIFTNYVETDERTVTGRQVKLAAQRHDCLIYVERVYWDEYGEPHRIIMRPFRSDFHRINDAVVQYDGDLKRNVRYAVARFNAQLSINTNQYAPVLVGDCMWALLGHTAMSAAKSMGVSLNC